jgi:hypothetical protein
MKRGLLAAGASGWLGLLVGCGLAANPQPPTLWMPEPVRDVAGARVGDQVHLRWTMPKNTTDKVALKGEQRAHICWINGAAPGSAGKTPARPMPSSGLPGCHAAGDAMFPPEKPAEFTAQLPAELTAGSPQVISYFVELENHSGKTAGPSNPAWVATGTAPPTASSFRIETRAAGVVLHWQPEPKQDGLVLRIRRTLVTMPRGARPSESNGAPPPEEQALEVDLDKNDPGEALDDDAVLDHTWRYTVERVLRVELDKHALEISGMPSEAVTIDARDIFAPEIPAGLAVVVDDQAHALDLSWTPDTGHDLAGYVVYRRDVTAGSGEQRISGKALVVPPSFEDKVVVFGHRYAYSVSAVDQDGNESAKSAEVEEGLPQ